jgi:hypothetical protein
MNSRDLSGHTPLHCTGNFATVAHTSNTVPVYVQLRIMDLQSLYDMRVIIGLTLWNFY